MNEDVLELAHEHHGWDAKNYIGIRLDRAQLKKAIFERDVEFFRVMCERLSEAATATGKRHWRCMKAEVDSQSETVFLIFATAPESHRESIMTHQINRLLDDKEE